MAASWARAIFSFSSSTVFQIWKSRKLQTLVFLNLAGQMHLQSTHLSDFLTWPFADKIVSPTCQTLEGWTGLPQSFAPCLRWNSGDKPELKIWIYLGTLKPIRPIQFFSWKRSWNLKQPNFVCKTILQLLIPFVLSYE